MKPVLVRLHPGSVLKQLRRYRKQLRRYRKQLARSGSRRRKQAALSRSIPPRRARPTVADSSVAKTLFLERADRKRLKEKLGALSGDAVILGPWVGSVNDELLYWLPFLRWLVRDCRLESSRLTAVSRGGVASWYEPIAASYVDVYEHVDPETIADERHVRERSGAPPAVRDGDVLRECGFDGSVASIQPELMLSLFERFRSGSGALKHVLGYLKFAPLPAPRDGELSAGLPAEFVAVSTAPDHLASTGDVRELARSVVERLPADVALVSVDRRRPAGAGAWHEADRLRSAPPVERLGLESAIVGRACGFVGAWDRLAVMALCSRVPVIAFIEPRAVNQLELDLAYRVAEALETPLTLIEQGSAEVVLDVIGLPGLPAEH